MHLHQENSFSAGEGDWLSFQYFYLLDIDIFLLRELTAEIELFEEEIANREQHALSLYRSIFDQCISQPVSAHNSGMASPVHSSRGARKHPRIILSSFCSSKKFQFQPFQVLSSIEDAGRTNILLKSKVRHDLLSRENMNLYVGNDFAYPMKRNSQPLKDHLYRCPSRISEEMVRCMAFIYCWMCTDSSEMSGCL
ncbi:uncharacterized protein LOC103977678 isoform X3 [Musa acuminata AAA Group]|uniref:uncharacterized protein LOC103977678 isoform X3 n=1 Tax=Musa acuminata AAA Group TaxID=214697 RepID=UPI0031E0F2B7